MHKILNNLATCSVFESYTDEGWVIVDVRDLHDGGENSFEEILKKLELVTNLMCSGYKVVVRCQAGISRSNTIACASMLVCRIYTNWNEAWTHVQECCPRARINMDLYDTIKKVLTKKMFIPKDWFN